MKVYLAQTKTDFLWLSSTLVINLLLGLQLTQILNSAYHSPAIPIALLALINLGICVGYAKHNFPQANYAYITGESCLKISRKTWIPLVISGGLGYYLPLGFIIFLLEHYQAPYGRPDFYSYFIFGTELSYWVVAAFIGVVCFGVTIPTVANLLTRAKLYKDGSF
ncbi:hypothetical protein HMPREF0044_0321 [Gleimia coleocanis DSM 15436]|uniref:Uncharacterized protein n=1 Tax=Gleimia coleocanis DSM 15436 TaxID=525245 RepID=C0VYT1_9ACTO|nr:hypothetical protein [Gleimia coleocanis]EEH64584.1 hypothetical protein HMPREF0044_0321 [Gleimia coleocanis DSM 15436]